MRYKFTQSPAQTFFKIGQVSQNVVDLDDLCQEADIAAWEAEKTFQEDKGCSLNSWKILNAWCRCKRYYSSNCTPVHLPEAVSKKREHFRCYEEPDERLVGSFETEDDMIARNLRDKMKEIIEELEHPDQRNSLLLYFGFVGRGRVAQEIADIRGVSVCRVQQFIRAGLEIVSPQIKELVGEEEWRIHL